jgi:MucR family transcriptional regulator, transcriptional regulator of exopolysaccharide biosynthesis
MGMVAICAKRRSQVATAADAVSKSGYDIRGSAHLLEPPIDEPVAQVYGVPERQSIAPGILSMGASNPIELAAEIVAAFISNNPLPKGDLPSLIHAVHTAVVRLGAGPESAQPQIEEKTPAVPIRKSITPDFLICLDDGKRFKSLRRHLTRLGLTPEQYREKWNLPSDYPMVAPNYAAQRSALAKQIGLGQIRLKAGIRKSGSRSKAVKA